ncbi:hypothetical protein [Oceanobacillus sp. FSL W7-1293]|uniref:hypothetical protein n=1 Tax=Oceanobacillus sp. FSL W7-1293 TaxID=2921699 RepID=UPI0030D4A5FE
MIINTFSSFIFLAMNGSGYYLHERLPDLQLQVELPLLPYIGFIFQKMKSMLQWEAFLLL